MQAEKELKQNCQLPTTPLNVPEDNDDRSSFSKGHLVPAHLLDRLKPHVKYNRGVFLSYSKWQTGSLSGNFAQIGKLVTWNQTNGRGRWQRRVLIEPTIRN